MYTVLIVLALLIVFGLIAIFAISSNSEGLIIFGIISAVIAVVCGIALFIMGLSISSKEQSAKVEIAQFESIRTTINEQRVGSGTELERVEMTKTIIEKNRWLSEQKAEYYNPWNSWFISKQYLQVKPLK